MRVQEVRKLAPIDILWYFMNERHSVYLKKQKGLPKPWTDDEILQRYKFTNIFRELDKDTIWIRENIRDPLDSNHELLLFNVALFRQTGGTGGWQGIVKRWDAVSHAAKYVEAQNRGAKIFTGAYMVTGKFPDAKGRPKVESLFTHALQPIWDNRKMLVNVARSSKSLEALTEALSQYIGWKGNKFMSYEVACDLLHTSLLGDAVDRYTWANPGPGAQRGLSRIYGGAVNMGRGASSRPRAQCIEEMRELLKVAPKHLGEHVKNFTFGNLTSKMLLDMRMCEHSLCEVEKYIRVLSGDGFPKGRYDGGRDKG